MKVYLLYMWWNRKPYNCDCWANCDEISGYLDRVFRDRAKAELEATKLLEAADTEWDSFEVVEVELE